MILVNGSELMVRSILDLKTVYSNLDRSILQENIQNLLFVSLPLYTNASFDTILTWGRRARKNYFLYTTNDEITRMRATLTDKMFTILSQGTRLSLQIAIIDEVDLRRYDTGTA